MDLVKSTVRRVGLVLLLVGIVDMGYMIYCILNQVNYSSSLNIFAVIFGILLMRHSMKTVSIVSFLAAFMLASSMSVLILLPVLIPIDFMETSIRQDLVASLVDTFVALIFFLLLYWVHRRLSSKAVIDALRSAGASTRASTYGIVAGIVFAIGFIGILTAISRGDIAQNAIAIAKNQAGPDYNYHLSSIQWSGSSGSAVVKAYNSNEIKEIMVEWQDKKLKSAGADS